MVTLILSPNWFKGIDSLFEIISLIICLLIAYYGFKIYKFIKQKKYRTVALSFLFIALSFAIKVITNLSIYFQYNKLKLSLITAMSSTFPAMTSKIIQIKLIYYVGYFAYRFSFLLGLILLLSLVLKIKDKRITSIFIIFSIIAAFFSYSFYYAFHIISAVLLFYIFMYFYENYMIKKLKSAKYITVAFFFLFISQLVFIFVFFDSKVYVFGEVVQLVGFLMLLYYYFLVSKK